MMNGAAIGFWRTVGLLLKTSRRRSEGRQRRQQELLNNRSGRGSTNWGALTAVAAVLIMAIVHGAAAFAVIASVEASQELAVEGQGKFLVHSWFLASVESVETAADSPPQLKEAKDALEASYHDEAKDIAERRSGQETDVEQRLRATVAASGSRDLISRDSITSGLGALAHSGPVAAMLGSVMLLWWFAKAKGWNSIFNDAATRCGSGS